MSDLAAEVQALVEAEKVDLLHLLTKLENDSDEIRAQAARAIDLSGQILAEQLQGRDTTIAENSLRAIRLNLVSAGGNAFASAVFGQIESMIVRVAATLGRIIVAL